MINNIGITGSLGSGKSHFANLLTNYHIIEVDDIRRQLLWFSHDTLAINLRKELINLFSLSHDDKFFFNREYFTNIIFSSQENLIKSSNILTPYIKNQIKKEFKRNSKNAIVWAYLIEEKYTELVDFVYILKSDQKTIKSRLNLSEEDYLNIQKRIILEPTFENRLKFLNESKKPFKVINNE